MYEAQLEVRCMALVILNVGARYGGRSTPGPGRFTPGNDRYLLYKRLGSSLSRCGRVWRRHNVLAPQCFKPQTARPLASRYTPCVLTTATITGEEFQSNKLAATNIRRVPASLYLIVISQLVTLERKCTGHTKYAGQHVSLIFTTFETFFAPESI
jgi:hypothetical protein